MSYENPKLIILGKFSNIWKCELHRLSKHPQFFLEDLGLILRHLSDETPGIKEVINDDEAASPRSIIL